MRLPERGMRRKLGRFAAVGTMATAVDVFGLLAGSRGLTRLGPRLLAANAVALNAAAVVSYGLNRTVTFASDPFVRWVERPAWFAGTASAAGAVDTAVVALLVGTRPVTPSTLLRAKLPAVAASGVIRMVSYRWLLFREIRRDQIERVDRPPVDAGLRLSVVVPAYREESSIAMTVKELRTGLCELGDDLEIVVVDDGSPDETARTAEEAGADQVVRLAVNRGKGAAVRAGIAAARGRTIVFTDADLSYSPDQVMRVMDHVEAGWDVVVGSRRHRDATTLAPTTALRDLGGRGVNLLTHALLLGHYADTQCGLKGFRSDLAKLMFEVMAVDGFAFDIELLHLVERCRLSLVQIPVQVVNRETSSVSVGRDGIRVVRDLLRIRRRARQGAYRVDEEALAALRS